MTGQEQPGRYAGSGAYSPRGWLRFLLLFGAVVGALILLNRLLGRTDAGYVINILWSGLFLYWGLGIIRTPERYFGPSDRKAHDPVTVWGFGGLLVLLGGVLLARNMFLLLTSSESDGYPYGLGFLLGIGLTFNGVRMLRSPQAFFGEREYDAHDPRTVRFFGGLSTVAGTFLLIGNGYGLLADAR